MEASAKVYGLSSETALWLASALENAAEMHWPQGIPKVIAERLPAMREAAENFHALAGELSDILMLEEVSGVEGRSIELDCGDEEENWQ